MKIQIQHIHVRHVGYTFKTARVLTQILFIWIIISSPLLPSIQYFQLTLEMYASNSIRKENKSLVTFAKLEEKRVWVFHWMYSAHYWILFQEMIIHSRYLIISFSCIFCIFNLRICFSQWKIETNIELNNKNEKEG